MLKSGPHERGPEKGSQLTLLDRHWLSISVKIGTSNPPPRLRPVSAQQRGSGRAARGFGRVSPLRCAAGGDIRLGASSRGEK